METNNLHMDLGSLLDERWNAMMDALETNWLTRISSTRAEYQQELTQLNAKLPNTKIEATSFIYKT
jgi:hypothetical protein